MRGSKGEVVRRVVMLGPPASGKGTQGRRLATVLGIPHVSTGHLLRRTMEAGDPFGVQQFVVRGQRVPDRVVEAVLRPALGPGFLLDGYPRTGRQAGRLDEILGLRGVSVEVAVELQVEEETLCARMMLRAEAEKRSDDRPDVFFHRLDDYRSHAPAIREHYAQRLVAVPASDGSQDEVFARTMNALAARLPGLGARLPAAATGLPAPA